MNASSFSLVLAILAIAGTNVDAFAASVGARTHPSFAGTSEPSTEEVRTNPFKEQGIDIELPDFRQLFDKIQNVSPLARSIINGEAIQKGLKDIAGIDDKGTFVYPTHPTARYKPHQNTINLTL